jgi:hypothetical protein
MTWRSKTSESQQSVSTAGQLVVPCLDVEHRPGIVDLGFDATGQN